ncbi:glucose-6-phosphate exchanger SLC37A4 [Nephila pilipes]|uniref:Glucose-6-phosphate exchanger SLC37A4 n=1 Tax=Nephila pilipes TaxID=299642 RepID=A0A8X6U4L6_NEPPI|nr:glucose-6-phosphate exchanger SLC37A4 [Nephila pilipes]
MAGVFVALFLCFASYCYNRKSVSLVTPQLIEEGLDASHAGLIITCQNAAFAGSKFFAGVLSDRINPRILFATGLVISGVATLLFSSSSSVSVFCAVWFLNGLAQGCAWPSCVKIIRQKASPSKFGTLWSLLGSGNNFSGGLSPILSVYLVTTYGWRTSVFTAGAISIVLGFFSLFALKGVAKSEPNLPRRDKSTSVNKFDSDGIASSSSFTDLLKDPFLWLVSVGFLVVFCAKTTVVDWGQLYLMEERKRTQHDGSIFTSSFEGGGFLGKITAGYLTDHLIRRQAMKPDPNKRFSRSSCRLSVAIFFMICSVMIIQAMQSIVTESSSLVGIVSLSFVLGTTLYGPITIFGIVASESAPPHLSGSAHAVASLAGNVGAMISGFPFCYLAKQYNWTTVFFILQVAISTVFVLILCCRNLQPKLSRRQKED